ncbi:FHA domain-containing protein [Paludisphaera soli]|uniref:FHA domain-containing protein n=1 Tax=Paludisphaera soli TaxID=2712865 RepID=UPI0013EBEC6C|nr:FHA domain-containing protein [Paludisphaera soli]
MAESTCLHIQDHDAGPIRIVEIPWISVRIGRAAFCEVRLNDPSLPEEACRLHRRGRSWHLTPLGGSDVSLDGRPIDGARTLDFDVAFQVGGFRLALKRNRFAEPDWQPPRDEPRAGAGARAGREPLADPAFEQPAPTPAADPAASGATAPLANPWEARWRAAGDRLKAARAAEARPATPPGQAPGPTPPTPPSAPSARAVDLLDRRPAPDAPRPAARRVEPRVRPRAATPPPPAAPRFDPSSYSRAARPAAPPLRPTPTPTPPRPARPPEPTRVAAPMPEAWAAPIPEPIPRPVEPASPTIATAPAPFLDADHVARLENLDVADLGRDFAAVEAEARSVEIEVEAVVPTAPDDAPPTVEPATVEQVEVEDAPAPADPIAIDAEPEQEPEPEPSAIEAEASGPPDVVATVEDEVAEEVDSPAIRAEAEVADEPEPHAPWTYAPVVESTTASHPRFVADTSEFGRPEAPVEEAPRNRRAVAATPRLVEREEVEGEDGAEAFDPTRSRRSRPGGDWVLPSVQDVLNAGLHRGMGEARSIPRPPSRPARATAAAPTPAREPAQWDPPAWLTAPPAFAMTLAVGGLLAFGSWRQAVVSHGASSAIQTSAAVRLGLAKDRPLAKSIAPPRASWWGAAPAHLAQWGVYLDGTRVEHGWDATAPEMLEAAAAAGPLDPLARFALARKAGDAPGGAIAPKLALGLSRDAVSLAWTGRSLHKAGKDADAAKAYRRALEIAARCDRTPRGPLAYSDDPNVPRYLLPGEDLAAAIVRELVADSSWRYADWAEALPETGVSALAAARVLKREGRPEADAVLRRILDRADAEAKARAGGPDEPADDPDGEAVALAVAAEAQALRSDWKDAERRYKAAIDRMADPRIRRSWWFNLADVAMHLNDDDQRRAALDEALAVVDSDEVSRRAMEMQRGDSGTMDRRGLGKLKAN